MRALILPVPTFIRNETGDQYNGRLSARTCRFNLPADQTSKVCVEFKVLTRVWALYHRSKSLCLHLSTNKKPDFSDAQSYMRYLSEDLFSPI